MKDPAYVEQILQRGRDASALLDSFFQGLSSAQLDWKPAPDRWSIGECLEHLIVVDTLYFPLFERIVSGSYSMSLWQRLSPLSAFWGRFLLGSVEESPKSRVPAPKAFQPKTSAVGEKVLPRFRAHQETLLAHIAACASTDLDSTILSSPALALMTYSLRDALKILVEHQHRHLRQALHVKETPGFPA